MTDKLLYRLGKTTQSGKPTHVSKADRLEAKARIEELELLLAKAMESLRVIEDASRFFARDRESSDTETLSYAHETTRRLCTTTLAELKGQDDE